MKTNKLTDLTDQELILEQKKRKSTSISYSIIIGIMIGVSIYGYIKNGFSFFTVMPVMFFPIFIINWKNYQEAINEVKSRNIK